MSRPQSWQEMWDWITELLRRRTGDDVEQWNARVHDTGIATEAELREWLAAQDVTGYAQTLLVMERFGYPEHLTASADELIAAQYHDRPDLRPVLDRLVALALKLGAGVQARKTYVTFTTDRRKFAQIKATTKSRVDLGLRLDGQDPHGRLESAKVLGDDAMTVRIVLRHADDVDDEVVRWLTKAFHAST